ncbi:hypothetical protein B7P43_G13467 [Cryptotermes secundus]|uniref:Uncharacterized protein n=1 Tax=Cryptotermes secundus TaxID=105785 RepID=A0A2J7RBK0_9NEOP|nr:hypothetical protein B7P43_G13467 [Cryptotermes secundus]
MQRAIWAETCKALVGALIKIIINTDVTVKFPHIKTNTTVTSSRFTSMTLNVIPLGPAIISYVSNCEVCQCVNYSYLSRQWFRNPSQ